jgi:hypothetical protein
MIVVIRACALRDADEARNFRPHLCSSITRQSIESGSTPTRI